MGGLVGRQAELLRIADAVEAAAGGVGTAIAVVGEAGIGKTALLREATRAVPAGTSVVSHTAHESERELPFAALATLLDPLVRTRLSSLAEPQAAALRAAFALAHGPSVDALALAAATFSLVAAAAEETPLVLAVDDAQWLDAASAAALLFTANRAATTRAVLLFALRDDEPAAAAFATLPALRLRGLDAEAAAALLGVPDATAGDLVARTGGNPLALLEVEQLPIGAGLADPVPIGDDLAAAFARRAAALPAATRGALLRAAVEPELNGQDLAALAEAEAAGLVAVRAGRIEFRHPLVRAAVYQRATPAERRDAHATAARMLDGRDPARRALHLARAAAEPDADAAAELERAAFDALGRGAVVEASRFLELAAGVTPTARERSARLAEAARTALYSGDLDRADALVTEALRAAPDDVARGRADAVRGLVLTWRGRPDEGYRVLHDAGERLRIPDPTAAAAAYAAAVHTSQTAGHVRRAIATGERAVELTPDDPRLTLEAGALLVAARALGGEAGLRADARAQLEAVVPRHLDTVFTSVAPGVGLAFVWLEDYERAGDVLDAATATARSASAVMALPFLLSSLCELRWWRGDFRSAAAAALEAIAIYDVVGANIARPYTLSLLARVHAAQGDEDAARARAEEALADGIPHGVDSIAVYAGAALALLDLGLERPGDAVTRLLPLRDFYAERGVVEPNAVPWLGDLAEAAVRSGDDAAAAVALADLDAAVARTGSRWAAGVAERARALGAGDDEAVARLDRAAELHAAAPFELARTRLTLGERLDRVGRRDDARRILRSAVAAFDSMGAAPWSARVRRTLDGADGSPKPVERLLSPQELQVALLVREGATNKEIAARLFISPKTVEYHLANAYRKLGIRSRAQLAVALGRDDG